MSFSRAKPIKLEPVENNYYHGMDEMMQDQTSGVKKTLLWGGLVVAGLAAVGAGAMYFVYSRGESVKKERRRGKQPRSPSKKKKAAPEGKRAGGFTRPEGGSYRLQDVQNSLRFFINTTAEVIQSLSKLAMQARSGVDVEEQYHQVMEMYNQAQVAFQDPEMSLAMQTFAGRDQTVMQMVQYVMQKEREVMQLVEMITGGKPTRLEQKQMNDLPSSLTMEVVANFLQNLQKTAMANPNDSMKIQRLAAAFYAEHGITEKQFQLAIKKYTPDPEFQKRVQ